MGHGNPARDNVGRLLPHVGDGMVSRMKVEVEEKALFAVVGAVNDVMERNNRVIEEAKRLFVDDRVDIGGLVGLVIEESVALNGVAENVVSLVENGGGLNHV